MNDDDMNEYGMNRRMRWRDMNLIHYEFDSIAKYPICCSNNEEGELSRHGDIRGNEQSQLQILTLNEINSTCSYISIHRSE